MVISSAQALKIGAIFFDPPLVYSQNQGFNIDISSFICQGLKENCDIKLMELNKVFPALDNQEIDVFIGVFITPSRKQKYIFSLPYMLSQGRFMALAKNNINTIEQLKGKKLGIVQEETGGGVFHNYVADNYPGMFQLVDFVNVQDILTALDNQSIDGAIIHSTAVDYWVQNSAGKFQAVGPKFNLGFGEAFIALPSNLNIIQKINTQLKIMESNGEYLSLYKMYFPN